MKHRSGAANQKYMNKLGKTVWAHFRFSQAAMCNGLKSVGTICYRAYGSRSPAFHRLDHIFLRGISISCEKLKCARRYSAICSAKTIVP
jgi:hypothetical protein